MTTYLAAAAALGLAFSGSAWAAGKDDQKDTPAQLERLFACRSVSQAVERLACFDRETAATQDALTRRDLVALDREKVRSTRRSLFGLTAPSLKIFGGGDEDELKQIDGVIAKVGWTQDGFSVRLQDQSAWVQTDGKPLALEPRAGQKVVVSRGVLGSFIMNVAGQRGVKVKRVN